LDARLLELGAGAGYLSDLLLKKGYTSITAGDWNASSFRIPFIPCKQVDCDDTKEMLNLFSENSFDAIIAGDLIEHLKYPWQFIETCYRLLTSEGKLILTTPNTASPVGRIKFLRYGYFCGPKTIEVTGHVNLLIPNLLENIIQNVGFNIVSRQGVGKTSFIVEKSIRGVVASFMCFLLAPIMTNLEDAPVNCYLLKKDNLTNPQRMPVGVGLAHAYSDHHKR